MEKEKCFALRKKNVCIALTEGECPGFDGCAFYKTVSQAEGDKRKISDHIASLPFERRKQISDKYYDGKMEWEGVPYDR